MNSEFELPPPPPALPAQWQADAEFAEAASDAPGRTCPNCGAPAHGPYCYACGQSEKGMIRHLSEVMSEFADIVFNVDSRIFRSLWDLYVRPGYLTREYLAGRRARYVTPFRLFFFLSIIAFFSMQMTLPDINPNDIRIGLSNGIDDAKTGEEVASAVSTAVEALQKQRDTPGIPAEQRTRVETRIAEIRKAGESRLDFLNSEVEAARTALMSAQDIRTGTGNRVVAGPDKHAGGLVSAPADGVEAASNNNQITVFGNRWNADTDPVRVAWLSDGLNARLNRTLEHMQKNIEDANKNPGRLLAGFFAVLPQTLFVLMPLFAVLLKGCYLFKRRLYMEHLLVALHSHAFIFMSVLVILGLGLLGGVADGRPWFSVPLAWLTAAAWIWLFLYLFLMQKRVYAQGWIMTLIKFGVIGISYSVILSFALAFAGLISLALT